MGFSRTSAIFSKELHKIYRDNIDLFHPIYKLGDTIFTHAGISKGWIDSMNKMFEKQHKNFTLSSSNIIDYIENEFQLELQNDEAPNQHFMYASLNSPIFCIGKSRGGDADYGGPFWSDFYADYELPDNWHFYQICGHQQGETTGFARLREGIACLDSRAIFEYDLDTHTVKLSEINDEQTKAEASDFAWEDQTIRFGESSEESK